MPDFRKAGTAKRWMTGALVGLLLATGCGSREPAASAEPVGLAQPIARCMNFGGALEAPTEGDWGYVIRRSDMQILADAGFDTVRLPVKWSAHTASQPPYRIEPGFLARVDQVVGWGLDAGLNVIIDVHHYDEISLDPAVHMPRLTAIWGQIGDHWRGAPAGVMFELLNEPHSAMTPARVDRTNRDLLAMLRQNHPDRWIILGGSGWGHFEGLAKSRPPYDRRVMTTFHFYLPFEFTHQGAQWTDPPLPTGIDWGSTSQRRAIEAVFDDARRFGERTGLPVFLGEFGVHSQAGLSQRAEWTDFVRRQAEQRAMGWCHWEFATGFPAYDLTGERWITPMKDALLSR